jgi:hypothetical protein
MRVRVRSLNQHRRSRHKADEQRRETPNSRYRGDFCGQPLPSEAGAGTQAGPVRRGRASGGRMS